jgi:hypothetical protein
MFASPLSLENYSVLVQIPWLTRSEPKNTHTGHRVAFAGSFAAAAAAVQFASLIWHNLKVKVTRRCPAACDKMVVGLGITCYDRVTARRRRREQSSPSLVPLYLLPHPSPPTHGSGVSMYH